MTLTHTAEKTPLVGWSSVSLDDTGMRKQTDRV